MNIATNSIRGDWWTRRHILWGLTSAIPGLMVLRLLGVNAVIVGLLAVTMVLALAVVWGYGLGIGGKSILTAVGYACILFAVYVGILKWEQNAAHRAVVQIQSLGGRVQGYSALSEPGALDLVLLGSEAYRIFSVDVSNNRRISDADLAPVSRFTHLRELDLRNTPLSNACLKQFRALTNLETLRPDGSDITFAGIADLFNVQGRSLSTALQAVGCNVSAADGHVTILNCAKADVTLEELATFPELKELRELTLNRSTTDVDVRYLSAFPNLRVLDLAHTKVSDDGLQFLADLSELEHLNLSSTLVSNSGLAHLAKLTKLGNHNLLLFDSKASFEGVRHLFVELQGRSVVEALNAVCHIDRDRDLLVSYDGVEFTDSELDALNSMPWLIEVYLDSRRITDAGISHLVALPALKRLHLVQTAISDDGLGQLGQLRQLTKLNLKGSRISDKGISQLAGLQNLETLDITDCPITDAAAPDLGQLRKLDELIVSGTKVTRVGVARLQSMNPTLRIVGMR